MSEYTIMPVDEPMSRRDKIAILCLSAMLGKTRSDYNDGPEVAREAVRYADALIAELDRENGN